jgi:hypothetical protein
VSLPVSSVSLLLSPDVDINIVESHRSIIGCSSASESP